jgi:hypothetical protein
MQENSVSIIRIMCIPFWVVPDAMQHEVMQR